MEERLLEDLKKAMKSGNDIEKNTIQYIRAVIIKTKKDKKLDYLEDSEIENILLQERKKRTEALALFEKGNRKDLMENTNKELGVIARYLPKAMTEAEIEIALKEIIAELGADKSKFGQIMGTAKTKLGNRADGRIMSEILKRILN